MKTKILVIYLQLFLFYSLTTCLFAQTDDIKKGTIYQTGGKSFEISNENKIVYRFNLSYDESKEEYTLKILEPKPDPNKISSTTFMSFDSYIIISQINSIASELKSEYQVKIADQIIANNKMYQEKKEKQESDEKYKKMVEKENKTIGTIGFRDKVDELYIPVYSYVYNNIDKKYDKIGCFKVENAQIAFGDGIISKININGTFYEQKEKTKDECCCKKIIDSHDNYNKERKITFYNFLPPIPIRTREQIDYFNTCDGDERYWLTAQFTDIDDDSGENTRFVYLSDILYYEQKLIYNYGIYIPSDGKVIKLDSSTKEIELKKESFINDFDLRIYTDFTALSSDNPNGLIKFMGNYNFKLNSPKLSTDFEEKSRWLYYWFNYMNVFFNFNKLESDKLITPIKIANKQLYSTSFDLYRYSKFEFGIDLNLFKWQSESMSYCINLLGGVYHTPIDSTFTNNTDTIAISNGVNSFYFGSKLNFKFQANEYIDFDLGYSFIIPQLFSDNKLKEICNSINDDNFINNNRGTYIKFDSWIHNINAEFSIYPDPEDKSSFIFLKSGIIFNSSDNYITLMLGYSFPFSNLISIGQSAK